MLNNIDYVIFLDHLIFLKHINYCLLLLNTPICSFDVWNLIFKLLEVWSLFLFCGLFWLLLFNLLLPMNDRGVALKAFHVIFNVIIIGIFISHLIPFFTCSLSIFRLLSCFIIIVWNSEIDLSHGRWSRFSFPTHSIQRFRISKLVQVLFSSQDHLSWMNSFSLIWILLSKAENKIHKWFVWHHPCGSTIFFLFC